MKLGLMSGIDHPRDIIPQAQWAEDQGFETVWTGEGRLTRNALVHMTLAAANTNRITVGSGIFPFRTRSVGLLGMTARTLDDLAPGRIKLGLGAWWEPLASRNGLHTAKPRTAMKEIILALKDLLDGKSVTYKGEYVDVEDIKFDTPEDDDSPSYPVPIYIGAVRLRMMELVGEVADGALMDFLVPPEYTALSVEHIKIGADRAGRSMDEIDCPQLLTVAVNDEDPQAAVDECKMFLTQYIGQQPHITETCGATPEQIAGVKSVMGWPATQEQIREATQFVPDELVRDVCCCGTTSETVERIEAFVAAGCSEPVLTPLGDVQRTVESIASAVRRTG